MNALHSGTGGRAERNLLYSGPDHTGSTFNLFVSVNLLWLEGCIGSILPLQKGDHVLFSIFLLNSYYF